ncbi:NADH dehydrogenase [ubiquinone] 1 beta subcomplex subunit NP15.6 [Megachile rotundata]|uniref:NADH dehydrogenase [ubiquinone] 1 beta subcomplex subunit NP15.6 n=1 Tax=Megachile rotundata TaxID=143995 RepID=UPI000258DC6E|nr:PREDICTED: NADH dehydrogenase [ubiquinone] 1 beta subcomplex subunit 11, mitochondrial [Megachile rotundata]
MSTLLRIIRSSGIRNRVLCLTLKDSKIHDIAQRSYSSEVKKHEADNEEPIKVKRTWTSYGFDDEDEKMDRHYMHQTLFVVISICFVGGAFLIAYMPDPKLKDWAQREAYLQLRYREENGLPLIDPNAVDPSKFTLPSEEELGDMEIII